MEGEKKVGLLSKFRERAALDELSKNTVDTYVCWLKSFAAFTKKRAGQWGGSDVSAFIHWMHRERYSSASRKQALCAVIYAFKHILHLDPGTLDLPPMPHEKRKLKIIPSREELAAIFAQLHGRDWLMGQILYGSLLRISECCELRVKDIDFGNGKIDVHDGKGAKDRRTWLPASLVAPLQKWIGWRAALHEWDLGQGNGAVEMPGRLARKYPSRTRELGWQFLFPSQKVQPDGARWRTTPESFQKAMRRALAASGVVKDVTPHTLRHAGATHGLRTPGNDIEIIRETLGHTNLETTQIYIHADEAAGVSPLDAAPAPRRLYTLRAAPPLALIS